jgi:tetratricopeptide (TPR) repeat protein/DNA-binding XRE family transcriptional regulator
MNSIGERLRDARLARGLTQQELARGLATKGFISQLERNRATPSLPKLRLLAERLGLAIGDLTGEQSPMDLTYLRKAAELAIKSREPQRTLELVVEAESLVKTANERADLLRLKGRAMDELGQLSEALELHQQAAAVAPSDDPELNGRIYAEMATVLNQQEHFNHAIEAGLRADQWLSHARNADPALRARVLTNLGRSFFATGQLARAHEFHLRALDAALDAENLLRIANAHMAAGVTARATGNLEQAIEHCNRALEMMGRLRQERTANRVLNNLGDVYWSMGKKEEARAAQQRCLDRARELQDGLEIGIAGAELARYLLEDGKVAEAMDLARESQQAALRAGDHLHQAYALAVEARAAHLLGHPGIADRKFKEGLSILLERGAQGKLAEVCAMYADVLRSRGQHERAFALMRIAAKRDFNKLPALIKARR